MMNRKLITMLLAMTAVLTTSAQSVMELSSIAEVRKLASGTAVKLNVECDTVMPTLDGGLCLSDGYRIRVEGSSMKSATIIKGTIVGTLTKDWNDSDGHSYPMLRVSEAESRYEVIEDMEWWFSVDLLAYEQSLGDQQEVYVNPWAEMPTDPRPGFTTVKSIKELKKLEPGTEARLTLAHDTVLFAKSGELYIRDGGDIGAIRFSNSGLDLQEGMVLLGSVVGRLDIEDGKRVFAGTNNTVANYFKVTCIVPYKMPYIDGLDDMQEQFVDDVVVTGEVVIDSLADSNGSRQLYATLSDDSRLLLTDYYDLTQAPITVPAVCLGLRCIVAWSDDHYTLYPLSDLSSNASPLGIAPVNNYLSSAATHLYNLQGQRLTDKPLRGVYICDGRKIIAK